MHEPKQYAWRLKFILLILCLALLGLVYRLVDLNLVQRSFLLKQSQARILRRVKIPAYRGMITDSLGDPLAISAPVDNVWVNPQIFSATELQLDQVARLLDVSPVWLRKRTRKTPGRFFIYLDRNVSPQLGVKLKAVKARGLFLQRAYKRFYPEGPVASHIVGLTNIDDQGQSGLELAYNNWLAGSPGAREVLKDRLGQTISDVALLKKPRQGKNLVLSINHRIQYLTYRALLAGLKKFKAASASAVVMNPKTGAILAMVSLPTFNPNVRPKHVSARYRNRAATDIFEPGSVIKPFTIALALESGKYTADTKIDTNPGWITVGGYKIRDDGLNYGDITLTQVLQKSSNVGAAKIMLSLKPQAFYELLREFGFGQRTKSGYPGEASGTLVSRAVWYPSVVAALAYGYGIAVTTVQLAHAYSILADDGMKVPVTFIKRNRTPKGVRVISSNDAKIIMSMLETVVEPGGTGTRAEVRGYRVAGKTGTAYISGPQGYYKHRYMASFVGMAPVSDPQLVVAVVYRDPKTQHFGGLVSAPVFSKIMGGALRILDISPDALPS